MGALNLTSLDRWITRTPAESPCRCQWCAARTDDAHELDAAGAAHLGLVAGDLVCDECAAMVAADLAGEVSL